MLSRANSKSLPIQAGSSPALDPCLSQVQEQVKDPTTTGHRSCSSASVLERHQPLLEFPTFLRETGPEVSSSVPSSGWSSGKKFLDLLAKSRDLIDYVRATNIALTSVLVYEFVEVLQRADERRRLITYGSVFEG